MNVPDAVRIGPVRYTIQVTRAPLDEWARANGRATPEGAIDFNHQQIMLHDGLGFHRLQETLLHEILHGIFMHTGLFEGEDEAELEHRVIGALTDPLLLLLKQNPGVVYFLMAEGDEWREV